MPSSRRSTQGRRLGELLNELNWAIHRHSAGETLRVMNEAGLTLPQMVVLHMLHHAGPSPLNRLSDATRLSASATSSLVDRLVERGLVDRAEDPDDRRQKRVAITPAGVALLEDLARLRVIELDEALSSLDPLLLDALVTVFEATIHQLSGPPFPARKEPS